MSTNPLDYAARNWAIFPIHSITGDGKCTCGNAACRNQGKHPRTLHGHKDASKDIPTILRWIEMFGPEVNWAVACGAISDLVVLDVDPRNNGDVSFEEWITENGDLPQTLSSHTGGGGRHYFFKYPHDGQGAGKRPNILPGVDFQGDESYVLLPPSRHLSGRVYTWADPNLDICPMPTELLLEVRQAKTTKKLDTTNIEEIIDGSRNDTLFRLACRLRRQTNDDHLAVSAGVHAYNTYRCKPPLETAEVDVLIASAFSQEHLEALSIDLAANDAGIRHLTDDGNAMRLIDYHGEDLRYVTNWGWMRWNGQIWQPDPEGLSVMARARLVSSDIRKEADDLEDPDLISRVHKWATMTEAAGRISAMTILAKADTRAIRSPELFDADDRLLACRNGILNLETGKLSDHSQDQYITRSTNVDYDPDARLEEWETFIRHACDYDDELVGYIQRAVGYSLSGSTAEECFFIVEGPMAAGKSTLIGGIEAAMGEYAGTFAQDTILLRGQQSRREADLAGSMGKRFISIMEMPEGERLDEAVVKQITGGDLVTARMLYKNPFSFHPKLKIWIGTNHDPRINDDAIWRRVKKLKLPNSTPVEKRDPKLKAMIINPEIGGRAVLAWGVRGYQMYKENGLGQPDAVTRQTDLYHERQDRIGQFLADAATIKDDEQIDCYDVYMRYTAWCGLNGERSLNMANFLQRIDGRGNITVVRLEGRQWVRGVQLRNNAITNLIPTQVTSSWGT